MRLNIVAVVVITVTIILAQAIAPDSYSWTEHTISQLAAQGYERALVMRMGFAAFGVLVALGAYRRARRWPQWRLVQIPLALYGIGILASALFSAPPFIEGAEFSSAEAAIHSIAATVAGIGISLAVLGHGFADPSRGRKVVHFSAFFGVIGLSALFGAVDSAEGLVQRGLWVLGFAWLIFLDTAVGFPPNPGVNQTAPCELDSGRERA